VASPELGPTFKVPPFPLEKGANSHLPASVGTEGIGELPIPAAGPSILDVVNNMIAKLCQGPAAAWYQTLAHDDLISSYQVSGIIRRSINCPRADIKVKTSAHGNCSAGIGRAKFRPGKPLSDSAVAFLPLIMQFISILYGDIGAGLGGIPSHSQRVCDVRNNGHD